MSARQALREFKARSSRLRQTRQGCRSNLSARKGNDWTSRYPFVVEAVNHPKVRSCVIDGEVVCCDEKGVTAFHLLRHRRNEPAGFPLCLRSPGTERNGPTAGADRGAQGDAGEDPAQGRQACA